MEVGTQWIPTDPAASVALRRLLSVGRAFFTGSDDEKERLVARTSMTGWRPVGVEYSSAPSRPDLNETFCYRRRNEAQLGSTGGVVLNKTSTQ